MPRRRVENVENDEHHQKIFPKFHDFTFSNLMLVPQKSHNLMDLFFVAFLSFSFVRQTSPGGSGWPLSWAFDSVSLQSGFWEELRKSVGSGL